MSQKKKVVIPKEKAVFWMDENGHFCNEHGRFEHPKVIRYFNSCIRKDDDGFFVFQETDEFEEKVYFKYNKTALFVVDLRKAAPLQLILNTGQKVALDDGRLMAENDSLFFKTAEDLIKFSSQSLIKLSRYIKDLDGNMVLDVDGTIYPVSEYS